MSLHRGHLGDARGIEEAVVRGSMTKALLVEEVARVADLTKKDAETIVDTVFRCIIDALHRGEKIELRGFGSFRLRQREPRKGRNPKTGDRVDVPPKKVPYFKPGKDLKELINHGPESPPRPGIAAATGASRRTRTAGRALSESVAGSGAAFAALDGVDRESEPAHPLRGVRQSSGDEDEEYARRVVEGLPAHRQVSPR